jgi:hypothetical protein
MRVLASARLIVALWWTALPALASATDAKPAAKLRGVLVTVDVSETPELKAWAAKATALVEKWHPIISEMLRSDGFTPPAKVQLVFRKDMKGIAEASGNQITIAASWLEQNPDDYGMVVHELTHVVQSYPANDAGWLVEGIADYVRFFHFEPRTKLDPIDPKRDNYRDGYRTAACFLAWLEKSHDKHIVRKLNQSLRRSEYKETLFKDYTGKTLDELWREFLASIKQ